MQKTCGMHIKVYDGTASNSGSNLCGTCRHATITRGRRLDEELVQCQAIPMKTTRITFKVTFCSSYNDARLPTYLEMMEDAWILQPASKRRPAGFIRASDLRDRELQSIIADLHTRFDE
jgi:hypothetical protein